MASDDQNDDWTPSKESLRRFLGFAIPLGVAASISTIAVAYINAPDSHLTPMGYLFWGAIPLFVYIVLVGQNTIEGCVVLAVLLTLVLVGSRLLPSQFLLPALCGIIVPWVLTRFHRRYCDQRPWIE